MTNKEIAKSWFAAIDAKDYATIKEFMHPDHKYHNPMTPEPVSGEEHLGMMQMMATSFTGSHTLDLVLDDGNYAVVHGNYNGKQTGEFNNTPPTGKDVNLSFTDIFEIIDGKIRNETIEMNPMAFMS